MRLERRRDRGKACGGSFREFARAGHRLPIEQLKKPVHRLLVRHVGFGGCDLPRIAEFAGEPLHFRPVVIGLARHQHGATLRQDRAESLEHAIAPAQHVVTGVGIGSRQPCGEADAAWHAVEFGDGEAIVGEHQVRTNDAGKLRRGGGQALQADHPVGLAGIEARGDPVRQPAGGTAAVDCITGLLKACKWMAERGHGPCLGAAEREGLGRPAPCAPTEETALGQAVAQVGKTQSHQGGSLDVGAVFAKRISAGMGLMHPG